MSNVWNNDDDLFSEYDENYAPMSLDEAYIDITDYLLMNPDSNAWDSVQVSLLISWTESLNVFII